MLKQNPMLRAVLTIACTATLFNLQEASAQKPYRGAEYRTKASYTYGRIEVRMKSAAGSGILTTLFTFHDTPPFSAAKWNEIDIEIMGRYPNEAQYNTITPGQVNHVYEDELKFNPHLSFHVYAFEWTPDYVAWFVDGYESYRQTGPHIATLTREQKIMMNMWQPASVGWAGAFDPATLPFYGYYDWVKYYAYTPGVADHFTLQWTDNFDSWDQSHWDKATHTFDGNNAQFIPENIVFRNGYMILCLTTPEATGYRGSTILDLDITPPYLVWARAEDDRFKVFFSEELQETSAETISNYTITGATIHSATLLPGNKIVELKTDSLDLAKKYVLVATGIKDRSPAALQMGLQFTTVSNSLPLPIKIKVGGDEELDFLSDQNWDYYQEYGASGGVSRQRNPGTTISGTDQPALYQTEREGINFYRVRVPDGKYRVTLMMADSEHDATDQRVFDVYAEGNLVLENLDVVAEAGMNTALEKVVSDLQVADGVLDLYFMPQTDLPILSALKVERLSATGVESGHTVPQNFNLQVYPNPFNPSTKVVFTLDRPDRVEISLFDVTGRFVEKLVDGVHQAGSHSHILDAAKFSAGMYFVRMKVGERGQQAKKIIYLK